MNQVQLIGRMAREPELRRTEKGTPVVSFALAGSIQVRKWKDKEGNDRKTVEVVADSVEFADGKDQGAGSYAADQMAAAADQQFTEVEDDDGELPF